MVGGGGDVDVVLGSRSSGVVVGGGVFVGCSVVAVRDGDWAGDLKETGRDASLLLLSK